MPFARSIGIAVVLLSQCAAEVLPSQHTELAPTWEVLVVNLARRKDRLVRFAETAQEKEPWLFGDARHGGRICRILGRDSSALRLSHSGNLRYGRREAIGRVPLELQDSSALVRDGWVTAQALDDAATPAAVWPTMTRGGIGLYLGHAAAWQHVIDKDLAYGLVVEDDLTLFAPTFKEQVTELLRGGQPSNANASMAWDFLYLQRCDDDTWLKDRVDQPKHYRAHNRSAELVAIPADELVTCTGAYIITRRGAQLLLSHGLPAKKQLDAQLSDVAGLRRAALTPPVAQCGEVLDGGCRDTDVQVVDQPSSTAPKSAKDQRLEAKMANTQNLLKAIGGLANAIHQPCSQDKLDSQGEAYDGRGTPVSIRDCSSGVQ